MPVSTVYSCDCCGQQLPGQSVLDCSTLTTRQPNGEIVQIFYGIACGCSDGIKTALLEAEKHHDTHIPPPSVPDPDVRVHLGAPAVPTDTTTEDGHG